MNGDRGDWCERLAGAVADGRYLENPDVWRDHVEGCPSCRELVQGLTALRTRIERTAGRVRESSTPPGSGDQLIAEAFRRYQRGRRIRGVSLGIVLLVGLAVGLVFLSRGSDTHEQVDPVAYAKHLTEQVFRKNDPDYDLLERDEALRQEYLAALDHESSLVRRTALQTLMYSGVELEPAQLERVLTTWRESLESPLTLAATDSGARHLEDTLARGRDKTLQMLFHGAHVQAARGGGLLDAATLEPFIDHPVAAIRSLALQTLAYDPTYQPGERIVRRLRVDENDEVRKAAATLLVGRGGDAGVKAVVDHLRAGSDWASEGMLVSMFGSHPTLLALSRDRIGDPDVPPGLALQHLRRLTKADDATEVPTDLIERALAVDEPSTWSSLAQVACEHQLVDVRDDLQARWQSCPPGKVRSNLGMYLVRWDLECCDESRLCLALDILEADRDARLREEVAQLADSDLPEVRDRAQNLLSSWEARN